ncbi:MAG: TA system VapC family ribonuclease toxin [Acidobacteriota bacterium]
MILVDANLLVYAYSSAMPQQRAAHRWLDDQLNAGTPVGLPWPSLLAFLRLVSDPRIFPRAQRLDRAWLQVEAWLSAESAWIPQPGARHAAILGELLTDAGSPRLVNDAHLAALAIEHGLLLCSTDRDFARFRGLRWENPLDAGQRRR